MFGDKLTTLSDFNQLFKVLRKRKMWKNINEKVLLLIIENSKSKLTNFRFSKLDNIALKKMISFISFAEKLNWFDYEFIEFIQLGSPTNAATRMSQRLNSNAAKYVYELETNSTLSENEKIFCLNVAELNYRNGILCDPLNLSTHFILANLYLSTDKKENAADICELYDSAEYVLLHSKESDINDMHECMRENKGSMLTELRNNIDRIKTEIGLVLTEREIIPEGRIDEEANKILGKSAQKLNKEWYPKWYSDENEEIIVEKNTKQQLFCKKCAKNVQPSFHGLCPACGDPL